MFPFLSLGVSPPSPICHTPHLGMYADLRSCAIIGGNFKDKQDERQYTHGERENDKIRRDDIVAGFGYSSIWRS